MAGFYLLNIIAIGIISGIGVMLINHPLDAFGTFIFLAVGVAFGYVPFFISRSVKNTAKYKCAFPYSSFANGNLILHTKLDDPQAVDTEATFLLVSCYLELKQFDKAAECSKELIDSEELSYVIPSYYTLPYALVQDGKADEAAVQYKDSISKLRAITLKNPEILDGYFFRALCLKETGNTEKALELCDYLIKIDDKSKIFHSLKAEVLMAMGLEAEAKAEKELSESLA